MIKSAVPNKVTPLRFEINKLGLHLTLYETSDPHLGSRNIA